MPDTIIHDTHKFIKRLTAAGMDAQQAEVLTDALNEQTTNRLSTKHDLELLARDLKLWVLGANGILGLLMILLKLFG